MALQATRKVVSGNSDVLPSVFVNSTRARDTLLARFNDQFEILSADTPARVRMAHRIRYQVYCIENPYENVENPDGLETDAFDAHAVHSLLLARANGAALGTVRLILPRPRDLENSFPIQRVMDRTSLREMNALPLHSMGEVSRFGISQQLRRSADTTGPVTAMVCNSSPLMRLGLMQAIVRMSTEHNLTHWCAVMEPQLLRMFEAMGIRFKPIGPLVEYHGLRQPCAGNIDDVLKGVKRERPTFWEVITDGGTLLKHKLAA